MDLKKLRETADYVNQKKKLEVDKLKASRESNLETQLLIAIATHVSKIPELAKKASEEGSYKLVIFSPLMGDGQFTSPLKYSDEYLKKIKEELTKNNYQFNERMVLTSEQRSGGDDSDSDPIGTEISIHW